MNKGIRSRQTKLNVEVATVSTGTLVFQEVRASHMEIAMMKTQEEEWRDESALVRWIRTQRAAQLSECVFALKSHKACMRY